MNPDTARDLLSQRILDLTLEMIFLLTGEGHMVVKIRETVSDSSRHQISEGHSRSQSFNMEPPLHSGIDEQNHEKILELTNKIIRLLSGEVPIRCKDVTNYVERHKDLYEDVMMEDHQPVITLDKSVSGEFHPPVSLWDIGCENGSEIISNNVEKDLNKTRKRRAESATYTERESLASEERHVPEKEIYPITEPSEYSSTILKEELTSCDEGKLTDTDMYEPPEHTLYTSTYKGSESHGEGDISHPDIFPLSEHTQTEYLRVVIKEEPASCDEGNLTDTDMCEPPEHTQTEWSADNNGEYLKSNPNPVEINHSKYLIGFRKPDHRMYYTDLLTHNSVYKGHSAPSSEMGKVSYNESDRVIHETNSRQGAFYSTSSPESTLVNEINCREPFFSTLYRANSFHESANKHEYFHTEAKLFSCPECEKCFSDHNVLKKHQRLHKGMTQFKCTECEQYFTCGSHLKAHKVTHTGEKPFKCHECGKCFSSGSHFIAHRRIHTGEKPFNCADCGKCFADASNLVAHKKIHTGEKPCICLDCGKSFRCASQLAKHKMIHAGEKPFKCPECGKCFSSGSHLVAHRRIHTGEKPFKCTDCGKGFADASNLGRHKMIHTGEKPFNCTECGKRFTRAKSLANHKKIHRG